MSQPVICFDLDGTLVNERGEIHPLDVAILARPDPPAVFVPCTGRLLPSVRRLFARHNLFLNGSLPFPMVLQNGAALYSPGEALFSFHSFPDEIQHFLVNLILTSQNVTFVIFSADQVYTHAPTDFSRALVRRFDLEDQPFHPEDDATFSKVMVLSEYSESLASVAQQADKDGIEQSYSLESVLELNPAGINKGRGLRKLVEAQGLWSNPLLVAGDGGNDLSLFELTPHTFAPHTAPAGIQACAARVIDITGTGLLGPLLASADNQ